MNTSSSAVATAHFYVGTSSAGVDMGTYTLAANQTAWDDNGCEVDIASGLFVVADAGSIKITTFTR